MELPLLLPYVLFIRNSSSSLKLIEKSDNSSSDKESLWLLCSSSGLLLVFTDDKLFLLLLFVVSVEEFDFIVESDDNVELNPVISVLLPIVEPVIRFSWLLMVDDVELRPVLLLSSFSVHSIV